MEESNREKLYRSSDDYVIAGVCGGIAEYFKIDTAIVRLIFIFLTLGGGSGFLIYLVLWAVLPKKYDPKKKAESVKTVNESRIETRERNSILGIIIFLVGLIALWNRVLPSIVNWGLIWPIILILVGLYLILRKR
jgi:phage shock protein PspC (stress-responsive transcriptional regulator)